MQTFVDNNGRLFEGADYLTESIKTVEQIFKYPPLTLKLNSLKEVYFQSESVWDVKQFKDTTSCLK